MQKDKGKISTAQAILLYVVILYTSYTRFAAISLATEAKQAAWLVPTVSFVIFMFLAFILNLLLKNFKGLSFMDIIYDVTSKFWGNIIISLYLIWLTLLLAMQVRFYADQQISSIYPNVEINIFIISMLILVAIIIRSGIAVIARMSEVIFLILLFIFVILMSLSVPTVNINNLIPISSLDIIPVLKANMGITRLIYLPYLLFFSHKFTGTSKFMRYSLYSGILLWSAMTLITISTIGNLGSTLTGRSSYPFFLVVKNMSILEAITGFESILVATWIFSDFIIIAVFTYSIMHLIKSLFKLREYKPFINIFLVILFFVTWILGTNKFELETLSSEFVTPINVMMQVGVPILIVLVAKIRGKV
ncbi:GerAB/ArcD/ProY family transporter [Mycoplasmatota bacterium WC44]